MKFSKLVTSQVVTLRSMVGLIVATGVLVMPMVSLAKKNVKVRPSVKRVQNMDPSATVKSGILPLSSASVSKMQKLSDSNTPLRAAVPLTLPSSGQNVVDEIYAIVNDEVITRSDVAYRIQLVEQKLREIGQPIPPTQELLRIAMERAVTDKIMLQRARDLNIEITDREVQEYFERLAKANNLLPEDYITKLKLTGVPLSRFLSDLRNEIIFNRLRSRDIDRSSPVTEKDIDNYLRNWAVRNPNTTGALEYYLMQIVVKPKSNRKADEAEALLKAQSVLAKAKQGEDLREVVLSDSQITVEDLGYRSLDRIPTSFSQLVGQMTEGQYADQIVQSPKGFHVLRLMSTRKAPGEPNMQIPQFEVRHILLRDSSQVTDQENRQRLEQIRLQIQQTTSSANVFDQFARTYSEDQGSATSGGYLGWVTLGTMVPEFEEKMKITPIGEVSAPFKTRFGWHILQVMNRRQVSASKEEQRIIARQALEQIKQQEMAQNWLKDLRDSSYVDYRIKINEL